MLEALGGELRMFFELEKQRNNVWGFNLLWIIELLLKLSWRKLILRKFNIDTAIAYASWHNYKYMIIDTIASPTPSESIRYTRLWLTFWKFCGTKIGLIFLFCKAHISGPDWYIKYRIPKEHWLSIITCIPKLALETKLHLSHCTSLVFGLLSGLALGGNVTNKNRHAIPFGLALGHHFNTQKPFPKFLAITRYLQALKWGDHGPWLLDTK